MASSGEEFAVLLLLFLVAASTGNAQDLVVAEEFAKADLAANAVHSRAVVLAKNLLQNFESLQPRAQNLAVSRLED